MVHDIGGWLKELGLGEYAEVFAENGVDLRALPHMTEDDLRELGVLLGHRRILLAAVASLSDQEPRQPSEKITSEPSSQAEAERRQLTVMFCDLVGSTELSRRLDPEDLRNVLRRYQDAVSGAVTRYGGHVAKFLGDGVLAYFGWPHAYEDQAERAVRAGLDAVSAVNVVQVGDSAALEARVGIATGQVVVGDLVGQSGRDSEAVSGETPNLAARLQQVATPGQVVVGEATQRLLGQTFAVDDLGPRELKGFDSAVQAWGIVGEVLAESRFEATHSATLTRFVGREHELHLLLDRWRLAEGGEGQVVTICGEAGIGKSRLMQSLRDRVAGDDHVRIRYQCSPYHTNSALYPTIRQIERAAGIAQDQSGEEKLSRLETFLRASGMDVAAEIPLFAHLLSLPFEARHGAMTLAAQQIKERLLAALGDMLSRLAAGRPVLYLFEDAHWIDPTSLELLEQTIALVSDLRVLLIVTHRPGWQPPSGHGHVTSLLLNRLSKAQGAEIVNAVTGAHLGDEVVARILARGDGIPLFIEELTRTLVEGGGSIEEADVPASLQASLTERLDRLGDAKEVAQIGSVVGREFSQTILAAVMEKTAAELEEALERLVSSGLIFRRGEAPDAVFSFKHALVRDTAYDTLLLASRRAWHRRLGNVLEQRFPAMADSEPEVVAHHWREAGEPARAIPRLLRAGRAASERSANLEAVAHLTQALELHDALPEEQRDDQLQLEILVALGPALMVVRGFSHPEVGQLWQRAQSAGVDYQDPESRFRIAWNLWLYKHVGGNLAAAGRCSDDVIRLAESSNGNEEHHLEAHHAAWTTALGRGRFGEARVHCEKDIEIYDEDRHHICTYSYGGHDPGGCGLVHLGAALSLLGFRDSALLRGRRGIELAMGRASPLRTASSVFSSSRGAIPSRCWRRPGRRSLRAIDTARRIFGRSGRSDKAGRTSCSGVTRAASGKSRMPSSITGAFARCPDCRSFCWF